MRRRADDPGQGEGQQRDDDVELLLDRQRPEVLHDARLLVVHAVGDALGDEVPVGHVGGGRDHVAGQRAQLVGVADQRGHDDGQGQAQQRGGQQAAEPAAPEVPQPDAARRAPTRTSSSEVIRKPDSTKNIDTPRKPPGRRSGARW